jgi:SAM-dependent methyltransferase
MRKDDIKLNWRCSTCGNHWHAAFSDAVVCPVCHAQLPKAGNVYYSTPDFVPDGFSETSFERLGNLAVNEDHFWQRGRNKLVLELLDKIDKRSFHSVVDLGCGYGQMLSALADKSGVIVGAEAFASGLATINAPENACLIQCDINRIPLASKQFDLVLMLDVLEHVEAVALLNEARRLLTDDGMLVITVPAFNALWSHVDVMAGHRCRYTVSQLRHELEAAGMQLKWHTYYQCLLFPLVWISRKLQRKANASIERSPPKVLNFLLDLINRFERKFLIKFRLPFGSTLVAFVVKNTKNMHG